MLQANLPSVSHNHDQKTLHVKFPHPYNFQVNLTQTDYQQQLKNICISQNIPFSIKMHIIGSIINQQNQAACKKMSFNLNNQSVEIGSRIYEREAMRTSKQKQSISKDVFDRIKNSVESIKYRNTQKKNRQKLKNDRIVTNPTDYYQDNQFLPNYKNQLNFATQSFQSSPNKYMSPSKYLIKQKRISKQKSSSKKNVNQKLYESNKERNTKKFTKKLVDEMQFVKLYSTWKTNNKPDNLSPQKIKKPVSKEKFLDRLKIQIQRRKKKSQYLEQLTKKLNLTTKQQYFKPQLNKSTAKSRVYNQVDKNVSRERDESSNSKSNEMNLKSSKLIKKKEREYLQSVQNKLFQNNKMFFNSNSIEKFDDEEFEILFPFFKKLEKNKNLTKENFEQKFIKYFQSLGIQQKFYLRFLNQKDQQNQNQEKYYQEKFAFKPIINQRSSKIADIYIKKITDFI